MLAGPEGLRHVSRPLQGFYVPIRGWAVDVVWFGSTYIQIFFPLSRSLPLSLTSSHALCMCGRHPRHHTTLCNVTMSLNVFPRQTKGFKAFLAPNQKVWAPCFDHLTLDYFSHIRTDAHGSAGSCSSEGRPICHRHLFPKSPNWSSGSFGSLAI